MYSVQCTGRLQQRVTCQKLLLYTLYSLHTAVVLTVVMKRFGVLMLWCGVALCHKIVAKCFSPVLFSVNCFGSRIAAARGRGGEASVTSCEASPASEATC